LVRLLLRLVIDILVVEVFKVRLDASAPLLVLGLVLDQYLQGTLCSVWLPRIP
jgi:hypothetical protein